MGKLRFGSRTATGMSAMALSLVLGACAGAGTQPPAAEGESPVPKASGPATGSVSSGPVKTVSEKDYDRNNFDRSTVIDNEWFPLKPGTQLIYEGHDFEEGERLPHRVVSTVTDLTKVVDGVRNVVVLDRDYSDGELVETEVALFAQDNDGNVWHLGQYPEEYEDGKFVEAPAWIAGLKGAKPGIAMKSAPALGQPDYAQGLGPEVDWTDRAKVLKTGQRTCVPVACYDDVLVTDEFSADEPGAHQHKYYARGVGNVRVGWAGKDPTKETLALVKVINLGPDALAEVRAEALDLEERAYRISKDVYAMTARAESTVQAG